MNRSRDKSYSGQAIAIVLIVLVVAVIIAMAILSRTLKDSQRITNEQESAESIEIADSLLDALKDLTLEDFAEFAQGDGNSICNPNGSIQNYDFYIHGCEISSENISTLINYFDEFDLEAIFNTVNQDLSQQCVEESSGYRILFERADVSEEFEIAKDTVFAFVPAAGTTTNPACQVSVQATPYGNSRLINTNVYTTRDGNNQISGYKEYNYSDTRGFCFSTGCNTSNWEYPGANPTSPIVISAVTSPPPTYYLNEVRLRAINGTVSVSASTNPAACVDTGTYMKISAIVNCGDNSRGKEVVVSDEDWAPEIFDYVLFNGDGDLTSNN